MMLDSKQPRIVISARSILLHLYVSAFQLGWAIKPDSWLRFEEAIDKYIHAVAAILSPLPAAYCGEKSALATVAITVPNVFLQVPVLKN